MSNYLPLMVREILTKTGWGENEVAVYSALLEKGGMGLTDLSSETGISISTIQYGIKKLLSKKMITKSVINSKPIYCASDIDQIRKWVKGYTKQFEQYQDIVGKFIDQYDFNYKMYTPKVRFYEGEKGVRQSYKQILKECEGEIWSFFAAEEQIKEDLHQFLMTDYISARVEKGIKSKNIASVGSTGHAYASQEKKFLSETRLVDSSVFPVNNSEVSLYGEFMHFMSFDEKSAFAMIVKDRNLVEILKGVFGLMWKSLEKDSSGIFMVDDISGLHRTISSREKHYHEGLKNEWKKLRPKFKKLKNGGEVLKINGHEVMSSFEKPYMEKLADIVTVNGGDVLNVGFGMGLIDEEIEKYRESRGIQGHHIIEYNSFLASEARKNTSYIVHEGDWQEVVSNFRGVQFDGIVYDGYPLNINEVHRDGIKFIEAVVERNLLKLEGVLTFYVDAYDELGSEFVSFLDKVGFELVELIKVKVELPPEGSQYWDHDHFLAPVIRYKNRPSDYEPTS